MKVRDPLTGSIYERVEQGVVLVTTPEGEVGTFDEHGRWIEGALLHANLQLCNWVGAGRTPPESRSQPQPITKPASKGCDAPT